MRRKDEEIKRDVVEELFWHSRVDASRIRVDVVDGLVTLSGEVPTMASRRAAELAAWQVAVLSGTVPVLWQKQLAEELASGVAGVTEVVNRIAAAPTRRLADDAVARDLSAARLTPGVTEVIDALTLAQL